MNLLLLQIIKLLKVKKMESAMNSYFLISDNQLTKDKVFLNRGGNSTFNTTPYSISSGFTNMTSIYSASGSAFFNKNNSTVGST